MSALPVHFNWEMYRYESALFYQLLKFAAGINPLATFVVIIQTKLGFIPLNVKQQNILHWFINNSLIETIENSKVCRQYRIRRACGRVPRPIEIWGSMKPTKCDQAQVNWTLRSKMKVNLGYLLWQWQWNSPYYPHYLTN